MNNHDAIEQAYKNGYKQGIKDIQERFNKVVKHYPQRCGDCFKEKLDQIAKEMLEGEK